MDPGTDLPVVNSAGHHLEGLAFSLFSFRVSFFFQGVLRFFLCIRLLFVVLFAHDLLLDKTCSYSYSNVSPGIVNVV